MNGDVLQAIVRKDLKVVFQNKGVSIPLIVAPVVILVAFAGGGFFPGSHLGGMARHDSGSSTFAWRPGYRGWQATTRPR